MKYKQENMHINKSVTFKSMSSSKDYDFVGYLATFGNKDRHGDNIVKGAFSESLKNKSRYTLFFNHVVTKMDNIIGYFDAEEDNKGLKIYAKLLEDDENASKVKKLIKAGALSELSVGMTINFDSKIPPIERQGDELLIKNVILTEGSVVHAPANPKATIDIVKSLIAEDDNEEEIMKAQDNVNEKDKKPNQDNTDISKKPSDNTNKPTNSQDNTDNTDNQDKKPSDNADNTDNTDNQDNGSNKDKKPKDEKNNQDMKKKVNDEDIEKYNEISTEELLKLSKSILDNVGSEYRGI